MIIRAFLLAGLLALAACHDEPETRVDANGYDSYWLWAGVKPQPVLAKAKRVYVLKGEVTGSPARFVSLRGEAPKAEGPEIWMVVRAETLAWTPDVQRQIAASLAGWKAVGLQVDFDAATRGLTDYASFLRSLRSQLPEGTKLSVTGLLDWSANGDPEGLKQLAGVVDEVVIQTYQGRKTIPGYERYLARLKGFPIPFRIGLVQHGEWTAPPSLASNPQFRGYVVFLVNEDR